VEIAVGNLEVMAKRTVSILGNSILYVYTPIGY